LSIAIKKIIINNKIHVIELLLLKIQKIKYDIRLKVVEILPSLIVEWSKHNLTRIVVVICITGVVFGNKSTNSIFLKTHME